jgi:hypothetical protein
MSMNGKHVSISGGPNVPQDLVFGLFETTQGTENIFEIWIVRNFYTMSGCMGTEV